MVTHHKQGVDMRQIDCCVKCGSALEFDIIRNQKCCGWTMYVPITLIILAVMAAPFLYYYLVYEV